MAVPNPAQETHCPYYVPNAVNSQLAVPQFSPIPTSHYGSLFPRLAHLLLEQMLLLTLSHRLHLAWREKGRKHHSRPHPLCPATALLKMLCQEYHKQLRQHPPPPPWFFQGILFPGIKYITLLLPYREGGSCLQNCYISLRWRSKNNLLLQGVQAGGLSKSFQYKYVPSLSARHIKLKYLL